MAATNHIRAHALIAAVVLATFASACGGEVTEDEEFDVASEEITAIPQSWVKRQSIGNCWLYATASWSESLSLAYSSATKPNFSESYWTYWHWFEEITNGEVGSDNELQTGGGWEIARALVLRYGVVKEADFIANEGEAEMSARQSAALKAINASLASGALKDASKRADRALVRAELDKAWQLDSKVVAQLDRVFGKDVARDLTTKSGTRYRASTTGTKIQRASTIKVKYSLGPGKKPVTKTLQDALNTWKEVDYWASSYSDGRRAYEQRIQKALHMNQPVIASWFVDFNALDGQGRFAAPPAKPGHQGGHMTVLHDYEIENVPGYGTLRAGVEETRPAALAAALDAKANVVFFRTKNSWGLNRPDRAFAVPGYHDLYSKYLFGKVKRCAEGSTTNCFDYTPMQDVVLPPGY